MVRVRSRSQYSIPHTSKLPAGDRSSIQCDRTCGFLSLLLCQECDLCQGRSSF
ncbi:hypothetical protein [Microcoleus sp. N9_A1]|uniref:hypothetical protein n=1 Tax=Microcoleus sp. N9_A1 TaxID=3055380 RepID=UPI002FD09F0E